METIFINSHPEAKIAVRIARQFGYEFSEAEFYKRETMNVLSYVTEKRAIGTKIASEITSRRDRIRANRNLILRGGAKPATSDAVLRLAEAQGLPINFVEAQMSNYELDRCDVSGVVASMAADYKAVRS